MKRHPFLAWAIELLWAMTGIAVLTVMVCAFVVKFLE